jgi:hypothetical protein
MNAPRRPKAALFVVGLVALVGAPSGPADARPGVGDRVVDLHVVDQTFGVSVDDPFAATLELSGTADELAAVTDAIRGTATSGATPTTGATGSGAETGPAEVRVRGHAAVSSVEALTALDDGGDMSDVDAVTIPAADVFADGDSSTGDVTVAVGPEGADELDLPGPGIYPVTIEVVVAGAVVASATTFAEMFDPESAADAAPLAVSIMAGVADPGPWPSSMELSSASIEVARLIELAEAVDGPLSIALPPSLVTALTSRDDEAVSTTDVATSSVPDTTDASGPTVLSGAPGNTEPAFSGIDSADAFGDAFRADELFASPAIALDPSSIAAVAQNALFTEQLRAGEDVLATGSPRAVVSRAVWFSRGPVSSAAMVALRDLGIRMLVVPDRTADELGVPSGPDATDLFSVNLVADGSLPAMTVSELGAQLQTPVNADTSSTANEHAVRLLVELQLHRAATGTPAVLLATPRVTVPDPAITAQFVELATGMPDISVVPVSRLPGIVDGALTGAAIPPVELPASAGPALSERLARVAEARLDASHATRMLVEPTRGAAWIADLTRVLSTAVDDATAYEHLEATHEQIEEVLTAIVPPEAETLRLTGTSSTLRLRVENTYDQPLNVLIHVRSPKLTFPNPDPLTTLAAGESRFVEIPVEARSNGTFTIEVDVLVPDRTPLSDPIILKARVTRLTGLSQVVTGAAALVLASWWYSHIRRSRRRRVAARQPAPPAAEALAVSPDAAEAMVRPVAAVSEPRAVTESTSGPEAGPESDPG